MNKTVSWVILIITAIGIKFFSFFPEWVERYYSRGFYPVISRFFRTLFGWLPFSAGDILYTLAAIGLLKILIQLVRKCIKKQMGSAQWMQTAKSFVFYVLSVYVVFNIFWGLNYNRMPVEQKWQLQQAPYNKEALIQVMQIAVAKINANYEEAAISRNRLKSKPLLFAEAVSAYQLTGQKEKDFQYHHPSVKPSLYSWLGCYMGYTGYYNPFTGEAQVNTMAPVFTLPFTTCHEIGHQLGYAKENEANFAGFMSARNSASAAFRYAIYLELYLYGARDLYGRDTATAQQLYGQLNEGTKKDIQALRDFYIRYKNPVEPYIRKMYGQYLKANEQPKGIRSYNEVIAMVIAYGKRYGFSNI